MSRTLQPWCAGFVLVLLAALAHGRAVTCGFIWDDDDYVTQNPNLGTWEGLRDTWVKPTSLPQYYPLVHTTYWVEEQLWGLQPAGYHATNVLLHGLVCVLWWRVLRKLPLPEGAAWLAAAVFAVHPVQVESVAWVTERKNVLSAFFYLLAAGAYLRFWDAGAAGAVQSSKLKVQSSEGDASVRRGGRVRWGWYGAALVLFAAALLSKTVTASLPAALLLALWWRERLDWRGVVRAARPLVPFFVLGVVLGLYTVYLERHHVGAARQSFGLTPVDRVLLAGRALWFYAGKLVWPHPLIFFYERWVIEARELRAYTYPLSAAVVIWALLRRTRVWGRGPAVGVLFFAGTLAPALGFFDVYPFRYSWAADHFQYLASMGIIAVICGMAGAVVRERRVLVGLAGAVLAVGVVLSFQQVRMYKDLPTLWQVTLERNPGNWCAHNNWGTELIKAGRKTEALAHFRRALELAEAAHIPAPEAQSNAGLVLSELGVYDEAVQLFCAAVELRPRYHSAQRGLAMTYERMGRTVDAKRHYEIAVQLQPGDFKSRYDLAVLRFNVGEYAAARQDLDVVLAQQPGDADALGLWAAAAEKLGDLEGAEAALRRALGINPNHADNRRRLGALLGKRGMLASALVQLQEAAALRPEHAETQQLLATVLLRSGDGVGAVTHLRRAVELDPQRVPALRALAWTLATHPDAQVQNGEEAVRWATRAVELTQRRDPAALDVLAAAQARAGQFVEAQATLDTALALAREAKQEGLVNAYENRLALYRRKRAYVSP